MGRGKDKVIKGSDIPNMSPQERASLGNAASMGKVKVRGKALVRDGKTGNAKYGDKSQAGNYGEDSHG